jgi:hypothetical protein
MVLAEADLEIAAMYRPLAPKESHVVFDVGRPCSSARSPRSSASVELTHR